MAKLERKSKNEEILSINEELNQCVFTKEGNHFVAAFEMNKNAVRLTVANINLSKSYKCPFPLEDFKSILHPKIVEYPEKVRRNILSWFKHGRFDFNIKEGNEDIAVLRFHNNLDEFEEVVLVIELIKIKDQKIEINALNEMLLQQSNQIEVLYTKAVQGNKSSKSDNQRAMINKLDDQLNEQSKIIL